jgi:uncharacterized protein (DUF983 family)
MPTPTYLEAVVQGKCPRCRKGNIFTYALSERFFLFNKMNTTCPNCEVRLEPEPGFYQGAMYIGYGITMLVIILVSLVLYLAGQSSEWVYTGTVIGIMILLIPVNYRYSRILYLYFFGGIDFDKRYSR